MKPNSSSTSNFEAQVAEATPSPEAPLPEERRGPQSGFRLRSARRSILVTLSWTAAWLVVLDVAIGLVSRPDPDPKIEATGIARYFEYGRSVESKLRHMVRSTPQESAPVTLAGWLETPDGIWPPKQPEPTRASDDDHVLVAIYGQSFSQRVTEALLEVDKGFQARFLGGPAAPLSHSFTVYEDDRGKQEAPVVTLGVLASSFHRLTSLTNMTLWFEAPQPLTYPRYSVQNGELHAVQPVVRSFDGLRDAVQDPLKWKRFIDQLSQHDAAYDPFVFEHDWVDYSTIGRAVRRAYGQRHAREFAKRYLDANGFTNRDQVLDIAEAIFAKFGDDARADGRLPYVVLFNDFGYSDHLVRALGPRLERHGVAFLSTDTVIPPNDPANYVPDGHFRPDLEREFAKVWAADLRRLLEKAGKRGPTYAAGHARLGTSPAED